jgi:hypothetical protein
MINCTKKYLLINLKSFNLQFLIHQNCLSTSGAKNVLQYQTYRPA